MAMQFNTYAPVTIRSHPGVRSDLFGRSLRETLVTDFFGGVSQADVLPPLDLGQTSKASSDAIAPEDMLDHKNVTDPLATVAKLDGQAFIAALTEKPKAVVGGRGLRAWASSISLIALVAWVTTRRK